MRGGKREGAGRPPRPFKIKVKQVEIPELLHEKLKLVSELRLKTIDFWQKLVEEAEKMRTN